jgi:hypothetical protein
VRRTGGFLCIVRLSAYRRSYASGSYGTITVVTSGYHSLVWSTLLPTLTVVPRPVISIWYTELTYELRFARDAVVTSSD